MNTLLWADIPVTDMDRARTFYGEVLQMDIPVMPGTDGSVAAPAGGEGDISFDLAMGNGLKPSMDGARIYFDPKGDMDGMLARIEAAGGKVLMPAQDMGPVVGIIAFAADTEGNQFGLRAPSKQA